jgi:hypothetical protein
LGLSGGRTMEEGWFPPSRLLVPESTANLLKTSRLTIADEGSQEAGFPCEASHCPAPVGATSDYEAACGYNCIGKSRNNERFPVQREANSLRQLRG